MPEFQPMSVGEILDQTFRLYRQNFIRFVAIVAIVQVPIALILLIAGALVGRAASPAEAGHPAFSFSIFFGLIVLSVLLNVVGMTLSRGALIKSVSESYLGNEVTVGQAYRFVFPRLGSLIWASVMVGLISCIGFLLFIVPGVIFSLWYALTAAAVLIENRAAGDGMSRSKLLAKGNLGKIFLVSLVVFLIGLIIGWLCGTAGLLLSRSLAGTSPTVAKTAVQTVMNVVGGVIAAPIGATAIILLYYDLRIRKEGFDLEMLAKSLGSEGARSDAAPR